MVGAYDLGKLDRDMLAVLMSPYRGTDIDSGGSRDLHSSDGKDVVQIVIETYGLTMPGRPERSYDDDPDSWYDYDEKVYDLFDQVRSHFGWR